MESISQKAKKTAIQNLPLRKMSVGLASEITKYIKESKTPILIYHSVESKSEHKSTSKNIHNVSPKSFKNQIRVLKKNYEVVFVDKILKRVKKGKSVNGFAAVTFDDGYKSVLKNALPVLKNLNIPATLYLSTKLVIENSFWRDKIRFIVNTERTDDFLAWLSKKDIMPDGLEEDLYWRSKDPDTISSKLMEKMTSQFLQSVIDKKVSFDSIYVDEKEINNIKSKLVRIGNHTHSHYVLSSLNREEQKKEVKKTERMLKKYDVKKSKVLSIPFGGSHTFNEDTKDVCIELGYEGILASSGVNISSAVDGHTSENSRLPKLTRFMPSDNNPWFLVYN